MSTYNDIPDDSTFNPNEQYDTTIPYRLSFGKIVTGRPNDPSFQEIEKLIGVITEAGFYDKPNKRKDPDTKEYPPNTIFDKRVYVRLQFKDGTFGRFSISLTKGWPSILFMAQICELKGSVVIGLSAFQGKVNDQNTQSTYAKVFIWDKFTGSWSRIAVDKIDMEKDAAQELYIAKLKECPLYTDEPNKAFSKAQPNDNEYDPFEDND